MVLAGIGPLGVPELLIIAFIVVLVFGVGRLPEVGGALGKGLREFRKSSTDDDTSAVATDGANLAADLSTPGAGATAAATATSDVTAVASDIFCTGCGTKNGAGAKFCVSCGATLSAAVS